MHRSIRRLFSQALGGSGLVDYQLYGLAALTSLTFSVLINVDFDHPRQMGFIVLANIFAFGLLTPILMFLDKKFWSKAFKGSIKIWELVLAGLVLGFGKGFLTGLAVYWLGIESELSEAILSRAWQTTFLGAWLVPVLGLLGTLRFRYTQERESLISERVAMGTKESASIQSLREFVEKTKSQLASMKIDGETVALSKEIRRIVDSELRPLSHQIWLQEASKFPGFALPDLLRLALAKFSYSPLAVIPLWLVGTLSPSIGNSEPGEAITLLFFRAAIFALILWLVSLVTVEHQLTGIFKFTAALLLATLGMEIATFLVTGFWFPVGPALAVASLLWNLESMLLAGLMLAFFRSGGKIEQELVKTKSTERENDSWHKEIALRNRQLAQFLHGYLQNRLITTALKLEQSESSLDLERQLALINQVLDQSIDHFSEQQSQDLDPALEMILQNWLGVANITIDIQGTKPTCTQECVRNVVEIANEGITNAVRHGFASNVEIVIKEDRQALILQISDDGVGPREGRPGLGSYFLDSVSLDWTLERLPEGARLRVSLPL